MTKNDVTLDDVLATVLRLSDVEESDMLGRVKSLKTNIARGVYYLIAYQLGFHPADTAMRVRRSRPSCIIVTKQYRWYYQCGDAQVVGLVKATLEALNNN